MVTLGQVVDLDLLHEHARTGYIRRGQHPTLPLAILNYTQRCQYDAAWTDVTRACRGLIYNLDTMEVVARPFPKFHNYSEHQHRMEEVVREDIPRPLLGMLDLDAPVLVTDKLDGSLGILYPTDDGHAVASRGSFTSEQALHATEVWKSLYEPQAGRWLKPRLTYLFEIIYPGNRIVCDYGGMDNLVLLAALETDSGRQSLRPDWPGPRVAEFNYASLADALTAEPRPGAEGLVVYFPDTNLRVKIKQDEYVALHRILTGTNARNVWEVAAVAACHSLITDRKHWGSFLGIDPARADEVVALGDEWLEGVPDEFYGWINDVTRTAEARVKELLGEADDLIRRLERVEDRQARYRFLAGHPLVTEIMRYLGADTPEARSGARTGLILRCWREATPEPTAPFARGEDVA